MQIDSCQSRITTLVFYILLWNWGEGKINENVALNKIKRFVIG